MGNTTRTQECWCLGMTSPQNESLCEIADGAKMTHVAECNNFDCGGIKPHNKLYWLSAARLDQQVAWPLPLNSTFPCSRGDSLHFSDLSWWGILEDDIYLINPAWHLLAKEYIAASLNNASGCVLSDDVEIAMKIAQFILAKCDNFTSSENSRALVTREKLARFNNGIGGLSDVDAQFGLIEGGGGSDLMDEDLNDTAENGFGAVVPVVVFALLFVALLMVYALHLYRQKHQENVEVIENETFIASDDEDAPGKDERSAEELRL